MASSIQNDLLRERLTTVVLKSLNNSDRQCQDIAKDLEQRSSGQFRVKTPTLNSCLFKLEKEGLVKSYTKTNTNTKKIERVYSITDIGRQNYTRSLTEWEYNRSIADKLLSEKSLNLSIIPPLAQPPKVKRQRLNPNTTKPNDDILQRMQELMQATYLPDQLPSINQRYQPMWLTQLQPTPTLQNTQQSDLTTNIKDVQSTYHQIVDTPTTTHTVTDATVATNTTTHEETGVLAQQIIVQAIQDSLSNLPTQPISTHTSPQPLLQAPIYNATPYIEDLDKSGQYLQVSQDSTAHTNSPTLSLNYAEVAPTATTQVDNHDAQHNTISHDIQLDQFVDAHTTPQSQLYTDIVDYATTTVDESYQDSHQPQDVSTYVTKLTEEIIQQSIDNATTINASNQDYSEGDIAHDVVAEFEYSPNATHINERKTIIEREYRHWLADLIVDVDYSQDTHSTAYNQQDYNQYDNTDYRIEDSNQYNDNTNQINHDNQYSYSLLDNTTLASNNIVNQSSVHSQQQLNQLKYDNLLSSVRQLDKGIVVRPHNQLVIKDYKYNNYYYCNQLMDRQFGILFLIMLAEIVASFVLLNMVFGSNQERSYLYYIGALVVAGSLPIYASISKHHKPKQRKRYIGSFKISMIFRLALFAQISAIAVFFSIMLGLNLNAFRPYIVSLILPIIVASNIPLSGLIFNNLFVSRKYAITE
jgi:PadR family transcriptional regulator PadR